MGDKILKVSKWLRNRTLIEKIIIHILLFPLPIIVLLLAYGIFDGEKTKEIIEAYDDFKDKYS